MNAAVVGTVPLQFTVPLLILGNLTKPSASVVSEDSFPLPQGYTAYPEIGVAYHYHEMEVSWHEARRHCTLEGGYLAVIDTERKLNITATIRPSTEYYNTWVGFHNFYDAQEWSSVKDGSPLTFFKWHPDRPRKDRDWHCGGIHYSPPAKMRHFDAVCDRRMKYLCEIPLQRGCANNVPVAAIR